MPTNSAIDPGAHFGEDVVSSLFDGSNGQPQFLGNHFIELSLHDPVQDLPLLGREREKSTVDFLTAFLNVPGRLLVGQGGPNSIPKLIIPIGFIDYRDRTGLHRPHRGRGPGEGGQNDYGQMAVATRQFRLEFEPAHARHAEIDDHDPRRLSS